MPITDEGFDQLVAEFANALSSGSRYQHFNELHNITSVVSLARSASQTAAATRLLQSLDGALARALLLWECACIDRMPQSFHSVVYRRCIEVGILDHELAWATLQYPESRAIVLDSSGVIDVEKLACSVHGIEPAILSAICDAADLPGTLEITAFPLRFLIERRPAEQLRSDALRLLDEVDRTLKRGDEPVRFWSDLFDVLLAFPTAASDLDQLLANDDLSEPIRRACATYRLHCSPAPDLERLPVTNAAAHLPVSHPEPHHRALFRWALTSPRPSLHYAGLTGLMALDRGHLDPQLIERFRSADDALLQLVAMGAAAANGDGGAVHELIRAAREAPHVVLRAYALRALRSAAQRPADYIDLCRDALKNDREVFNNYYAPVTSEAALCLARHEATPESCAIDALVDAALHLVNDDAWFAIESAICSWRESNEVSINPVWYRKWFEDSERDQ